MGYTRQHQQPVRTQQPSQPWRTVGRTLRGRKRSICIRWWFAREEKKATRETSRPCWVTKDLISHAFALWSQVEYIGGCLKNTDTMVDDDVKTKEYKVHAVKKKIQNTS
jgi:hypothetical protein